jgi:hypothetical protein
MPTERRPANAAAYDKLYAKHFMLLKTCMATAAASRTAPCATRMLALNTAPGGAGAFVSATVIGTGQNVQAFAAPLSATAPPVPVDVAPGSMLQLGWQADSTFEACTIEATMPPGVMVPSSGGSASGSVATGSNWALPQSPPLLGPLTVPGIYDFSLYCGDTYTATVQFQLSGQPPVLLQLATAVNDDVKATAVDSVSSKNLATSTNVRLNDSVELTWIAENVVPDSCSINGPGLTASGEAGSTTFTFSASSDQLFTFTCQGTDGLPHTLTSTLHLTPAVACDVNGDGKIDSSDISLIMAALNTRALTGDPRDADANGTIDVVDARICTTRCTNKNCAP